MSHSKRPHSKPTYPRRVFNFGSSMRHIINRSWTLDTRECLNEQHSSHGNRALHDVGRNMTAKKLNLSSFKASSEPHPATESYLLLHYSSHFLSYRLWPSTQVQDQHPTLPGNIASSASIGNSTLQSLLSVVLSLQPPPTNQKHSWFITEPKCYSACHKFRVPPQRSNSKVKLKGLQHVTLNRWLMAWSYNFQYRDTGRLHMDSPSPERPSRSPHQHAQRPLAWRWTWQQTV